MVAQQKIWRLYTFWHAAFVYASAMNPTFWKAHYPSDER